MADKLYQRACGYSHQSEKIFNNQGEVIRAECTEHYAPDTGAIALWLKNRQPKKWRDKQDVALTGADGGPVETKLTIEYVNKPCK